MKPMLTLLLVINAWSANSQVRDFDKECFAIFIRVLYFANALDKADDTFMVYLPKEEFKSFFVKKVDTGEKVICLKKTDLEKENSKLLILNSIEKVKPTEFIVHFNSRHNGGKYTGEVRIGIEDGKPVFIDKYIMSSIN